ncbi:MAG: DUF4911 domain-containing protein [Nitrospinaceae bacterium]|nr:DUF4911 domain-containing protein [Nitrospinaceae bacterium]MBT3434180.1 DUF4911 domain-containing protein [Nitrospinaceae bacterium]MBT3821011.1 DUF4911 domain-containing protein [Nitrospinaceae bacterium]MBT4093046.1 DUF4911 domain-containing protein [Nitrospinaceae bacterium]MBT5369495.1 DUF4911 domain-containing protein [Nitrospinaceae bacterium]
MTLKPPASNPVSFSGSLIYWLEVPSDKQHFIHGILDGYDNLGYYQTMVHGWGERVDGGATSLARITSTEDTREEMDTLLEALSADFGLKLLDEAPDIAPDFQPVSRKPGDEAENA